MPTEKPLREESATTAAASPNQQKSVASRSELPPSAARLEVTIPEESFVAGGQCLLRIIIRNTYDRPIKLLDIAAPRASNIGEARGDVTIDGQGRHSSEARVGWWKRLLRALTRAFTDASLSVAGIGFTMKEPAGRHLVVTAEPRAKIKLEQPIDGFDNISLIASEGSEIDLSPKTPPEKPETELQPQCEWVAYVQLATAGWLLFQPQRQNLSTLITYQLDDVVRTQVVSTTFDTRPPLRSVMVGAVLGGVLGAVARILNKGIVNAAEIAVMIAGTVVMSLIATVSLSRKNGAQTFITVEDFFGGFVLGTLVGYGGATFFDQNVMMAHPSTPGPPPR